MTVSFPPGFLWGAATAAYQIEGAVAEDGRGASIWDTFSATPGRTYAGHTGAVATDHYHRLDEDLDLMARMGLGAYRFSVAWPRVQPEGRGPVNQRGLDFYRRLVEGLLERGITPFLTLYHWDLPQALQDVGGWPERDTAGRFADYAARVHDALADRVQFWTTLNEPEVSAFLGHAVGIHAPGIADDAAALRAAHHLLLGHGLAVQAMRTQAPGDNRFGLVVNLSPVRPASGEEADVTAARLVDALHNRLFLAPATRASYPDEVLEAFSDNGEEDLVRPGDAGTVGTGVDFLGVNYYFGMQVRSSPGTDRRVGLPGLADVERVPVRGERTAMGWPIEPGGLTDILRRVAGEVPGVPLYVTENGVALDEEVSADGTVDDRGRIEFLDAHIRAAHDALASGVDLRGYFVWSLLDNFEWAHGYAKRFGLVRVDYDTLARAEKASAHWYREVIARNGLAEGTD